MNRTENDLRDALRDLEHRADRRGAPSTASILEHATKDRPGRTRSAEGRRVPRWLAPLAAAAVIAAAAATTATLGAEHSSSSQRRDAQPAGQPARTHSTTPALPPHTPSANPEATSPVAVLNDAATKLDDAPRWTAPAPQNFYYVRTTDATTWTSVSGTQAGEGRTAAGVKIWVPGCRNGQIVSTGQSGACTLSDVPHYLGDAPTTPTAWDAYLEHIAPGAKAANAQGKIIIGVLHEDLTSPQAAAALLRYTTSCPGLHTLTVQPVAGEKLIGVTCTSMTNGSYGLAFDAASHALVGFVGVTPGGRQDGPTEIVRKTGIVPAIGQTP